MIFAHGIHLIIRGLKHLATTGNNIISTVATSNVCLLIVRVWNSFLER